MNRKNRSSIFGKYLPAVGALLLTAGISGCVLGHDIEQEQDGSKFIVFSPKVDKNTVQSRAAAGHPVQSEANIPSGKSFGAYAYGMITPTSDIEPYASLRNTKVTSGGTSFTYDPVAKWPVQSSAKLAFYGYYPWQDQNTSPAPGEPVIDVTMGATNSPSMTIAYITPSDPGRQVDLMWARTDLKTGYDPVEMIFGHALTRVNFTARVKDYPQAMVITKITVKNVLTKGTLTVPEENAPAWGSLSSAVDMSLTADNGLLPGVRLTGRPESIIKAGADMLVIPQGTGNLKIQVEATMDGKPLPEPFVFPLTTSLDWAMNKIVTYEIILGSDGIDIAAKVNDWDENSVNIIYDRQWWLSVSDDDFEFKLEGDSAKFTSETNYDITTQGFPVGLQITGAEIEYLSGVGAKPGDVAESDWITLDLSRPSNSLSQTVSVKAAENKKSVERMAKIKVRAGNITKIINVTQEPGLPTVSRDDISRGGTRIGTAPYVGAFWRKSQTGERVISISVPKGSEGYWSAQVFFPGDFGSDIRFSTAPSDDPKIGTDNPANMNSQENDTRYNVLDGKEYVTGKIQKDKNEKIFFRIGLNSKWDSSSKPVRYAIVVIGYANNTRFQAFYLRQGEDPDYLMSQGDKAKKDIVRKFSPYNLRAGSMTDNVQYVDLNKNDGTFVDYPSQAGSFFKWVGPKNYERRAWHPSRGIGANDYGEKLSLYDKSEWNDEWETCPTGYRRPKTANYDAETTSEFALSLLSDHSVNNIKNSLWGCYADGFFDRRTIVTPNGTLYTSNSAVNKDSHNAAYIGRLFFNDIAGSIREGASIFFPAAGCRSHENGRLESAGTYGFYWSSTPTPKDKGKTTYSHGYTLETRSDTLEYFHSGFNRARGATIRCVVDK
ncbi:MAG: fimbrillin family protein [Proteiniphilum sp.]|jgi:hypothetical protein|nr:fimbrillin family protein [Proteiniphilum sp.]